MACNFCEKEIYIKIVQHTMPVLAPITRADELRHELINLTGEIYLPIKTIYCPMCGEKRGERKERMMETNEKNQIEEMAKDLFISVCWTELEDGEVAFDADRTSINLHSKGYRKASDVAEKIFEDAKRALIDFWESEDKKYITSHSKSEKQFNIETARYRAITDAVKFAIGTLNEIEKKYTEVRK